VNAECAAVIVCLLADGWNINNRKPKLEKRKPRSETRKAKVHNPMPFPSAEAIIPAEHLMERTRDEGEDSVMASSEAVVYTSRVRIERVTGPVRRAYLPAEKEPVVFGVHSEVAEHYNVSPDAFEPRATTLDYVVAATGG
jgi:hypothetical protein